jgi:hypothetical protein
LDKKQFLLRVFELFSLFLAEIKRLEN